MGLTRADYRTAVTLKGFDSVTQADAINDAINDARRDLLNEQRWAWLEALGNETLTTTIGSGTVSTAPITDLLYIDAVRMERNGVGYDLTPMTLQEFRTIENLDRANAAPLFWSALDGASPTAIRLGPRPDQVYTLVVDYVKTAADLADDVAVDIIPPAAKNAIVWKACEHLAYRVRQFDAAAVASQNYQREFLKLQRQENMGQRQKSSHVRNSGYWDVYDGGAY